MVNNNQKSVFILLITLFIVTLAKTSAPDPKQASIRVLQENRRVLDETSQWKWWGKLAKDSKIKNLKWASILLGPTLRIQQLKKWIQHDVKDNGVSYWSYFWKQELKKLKWTLDPYVIKFPDSPPQCVIMNSCVNYRIKRFKAIIKAAESVDSDERLTSEKLFPKNSENERICGLLGGQNYFSFWGRNGCMERLEITYEKFVRHLVDSEKAVKNKDKKRHRDLAKIQFKLLGEISKTTCVENLVSNFSKVTRENRKCWRSMKRASGKLRYFRKSFSKFKLNQANYYSAVTLNIHAWTAVLDECQESCTLVLEDNLVEDETTTGGDDGTTTGGDDGTTTGGDDGTTTGGDDGTTTGGDDGVTTGGGTDTLSCPYASNLILNELTNEVACVPVVCTAPEVFEVHPYDPSVYYCFTPCDDGSNVEVVFETGYKQCVPVVCNEVSENLVESAEGLWECVCKDFYNAQTGAEGQDLCIPVDCLGSALHIIVQNAEGIWYCNLVGLTCQPGETPVYNDTGTYIHTCYCQSNFDLVLNEEGNHSCTCSPGTELFTNPVTGLQFCGCQGELKILPDGSCGCDAPFVAQIDNTCACHQFETETQELFTGVVQCTCKLQYQLPFPPGMTPPCSCPEGFVLADGDDNQHQICACPDTFELVVDPFNALNRSCVCPENYSFNTDSLDCICDGTSVDPFTGDVVCVGDGIIDGETGGGDGVITGR